MCFWMSVTAPRHIGNCGKGSIEQQETLRPTHDVEPRNNICIRMYFPHSHVLYTEISRPVHIRLYYANFST